MFTSNNKKMRITTHLKLFFLPNVVILIRFPPLKSHRTIDCCTPSSQISRAELVAGWRSSEARRLCEARRRHWALSGSLGAVSLLCFSAKTILSPLNIGTLHGTNPSDFDSKSFAIPFIYLSSYRSTSITIKNIIIAQCSAMKQLQKDPKPTSSMVYRQ